MHSLSFTLFLDSSLGSFRNDNDKNHRGNYNNLHDITTTNPFHFYTNPKWYESYFDPVIPRNITALVGKSAYMSCRVKNLGNKTVSVLIDIMYYVLCRYNIFWNPLTLHKSICYL